MKITTNKNVIPHKPVCFAWVTEIFLNFLIVQQSRPALRSLYFPFVRHVEMNSSALVFGAKKHKGKPLVP